MKKSTATRLLRAKVFNKFFLEEIKILKKRASTIFIRYMHYCTRVAHNRPALKILIVLLLKFKTSVIQTLSHFVDVLLF